MIAWHRGANEMQLMPGVKIKVAVPNGFHLCAATSFFDYSGVIANFADENIPPINND